MKILVPTDGSKAAQAAVKYAAKLAKMIDADKTTVTLVSVHDDTGLRHARAFVSADEIATYLRELSEKELKSARKVLDTAGIKHDMVIRTGHVAEQIVGLAHSDKYDMIVMGAKGRSAIADLLIGSVSKRVLARAKPPVVLVK